MRYSKYEMVMKQSNVYDSKYDYRVGGSQDVRDFAVDILEADVRPEEHFYALSIGTKGDIIGINEASIGDICQTVAGAREIFRTAIMQNAGSIVLVHNHPSGDPTPSEQDIRTTERLAHAGHILGINVLDHLIISRDGFVSMQAEGLIKQHM